MQSLASGPVVPPITTDTTTAAAAVTSSGSNSRRNSSSSNNNGVAIIAPRAIITSKTVAPVTNATPAPLLPLKASSRPPSPVSRATAVAAAAVAAVTPSSDEKPRRLLFVSHYRSSLLLSTALAILAVDFHIFPRRFVKTEDYGTSLVMHVIFLVDMSYHA